MAAGQGGEGFAFTAALAAFSASCSGTANPGSSAGGSGTARADVPSTR